MHSGTRRSSICLAAAGTFCLGLSLLRSTTFCKAQLDRTPRLAWLTSVWRFMPPYWVLLGTGIVALVNGLSEVKIGISRTLGKPVESHHEKSFEKGTGRRLGLMERWYVAHSRKRNHKGLTLALELESPTGVPTLRDVEQILRRVALQHPMLRARIFRDGVQGVDSTGNLIPTSSFRPNKSQRVWGDDLYLWVSHETTEQSYFSLEDSPEELDRDHREGEGNGLRRVLEEHSAWPWRDEDPSMPLWRARLIRWKSSYSTFALVLSFHHCIVDGIGATAVARTIVEESARQSSPPLDEDIICTKIPPPMEDVLDTVPRVCDIWRPLLLDLFPMLGMLLSPRVFSGSPKIDRALQDRSESMACFELCSHNEVQQLYVSCRSRGITVHVALVIALCKAIALHVRNESVDYDGSTGILGDGSIRFRIASPINQRQQCNPPSAPSDLGVRISAVYQTVKIGPHSETQRIANAYSKSMREQRKESPRIAGLTAFISEDWLDFSEKVSKPNNIGDVDSMDASNLGLVSFASQPGAWKVQGIWFIFGRQNPAPALKAGWVTTEGGRLNLVLSTLPSKFSHAALRSIGSLYKQELWKYFADQNN